MSNILKIKRTQDLEFSGDEFKVVNKKDNKLKFVGELIADYVTSSINNFNDEYRHMRDDREFIFVSEDYSHLDSFLEAKEKIEIFSYKFNNDNEFNFIRDFFKFIKHVETEIVLSTKPKKKDYFSYVYDYGELIFTFKFYPDSKTKLISLKYKGDTLVEFSEYMDFGIKIIECVHPIFSAWDTKMKGNEYTDAIDWLLELEKYVVNTCS